MLFAGMQWCRCLFRYAMNANALLWVCHECKCPLENVSWCKCFGANTIYSKISFIFKMRLPQRLKPKYFQTQFIIHEKSSSFWLKAPKENWWSLLENFWMGHLLEIWWSGSKDLFSQFDWTKGVAYFRGPFLEKWILWKSSILKRLIFS